MEIGLRKISSLIVPNVGLVIDIGYAIPERDTIQAK
jgi:hypothetical protein